MATPVTATASPFAFLNTASLVENTSRSASATDFQRALQSQLNSSRAAERSASTANTNAQNQATSRAETPRPQASSSDNASRPKQAADGNRNTEPASARPSAKGETGQQTSQQDTNADATQGDSTGTTAEPETATVDTTESPASEPALAALPALIAALMPALAGTPQTAAADDADPLAEPIASDDTTLGAMLTGKGDTPGKSLQNPDLLKDKVEPPASNTPQANAAAALQTKADPRLVLGERPSVSAQASVEQPNLHPGLMLQPTRHTSAATTPQLPVATPANQQGWAEEVNNRVMWMVGRAESKAELVLTPANLGKVEVSINLNGDQTTAQFVAASQAARDALEQSMPKLRELLAQSGISLGQTSVGTSSEQGAEHGGHSSGGRGSHGAADTDSLPVGAQRVQQLMGLVDTFV